MSREIKFRAFERQTNKMYYQTQSSLHTTFPYLTLDGKLIVAIETGEMEDATQNNFELMQSTGLKDSKGVEIYEGDVCKANQRLYEKPSPLTVKIVYNSDKARFEPQQFWRGDKEWKSFFNVFDDYEFEVIGNIYEHPELLTTPDNQQH